MRRTRAAVIPQKPARTTACGGTCSAGSPRRWGTRRRTVPQSRQTVSAHCRIRHRRRHPPTTSGWVERSPGTGGASAADRHRNRDRPATPPGTAACRRTRTGMATRHSEERLSRHTGHAASASVIGSATYVDCRDRGGDCSGRIRRARAESVVTSRC